MAESSEHLTGTGVLSRQSMKRKVIGERIGQRENARLVMGQGEYVGDITFPDMLHLAILRSPHAHAQIRGIDAGAAKELDGVEAVFTSEEIAHLAPALPTASGLPGLVAPDHHPLARRRVRFVGEAVAAVLARDRAVAEDALERIDVAYTVLPAIADPEKALEAGAPRIHEELDSNLSFQVSFGGDRSEALRGAEIVLCERMENQRLIPSPMETRGVVARPEANDGRLTIYLSTQAPHLMRTQIASYLGVSEERVRVIAPDVGGAFGAKNNPYPEELLAAALSLHLGKPIKWIEDRLENMVATSHGRGQIAYVEATAQQDGTLTSLHLRIILDIGAYHHILTPMGPFQTAMLMTGCYRIPVASVKVLGAFTNKTPVDPYRGFGRAEAAYYIERIMDRMARELEIDPVEIRRHNFIPPDAFPYATPLGHVHESGAYEACLDKALSLIDYEAFRRRQCQLRSDGRHLGIGIASYVWRGGFPSSSMPPDFGYIKGGWERAAIRVEPSGRITLLTGVSPHGQGIETTFSQVVSETLGVPLDTICVLHGDTDAAPYGNGTMGSRSLAVGGSAVLGACEELIACGRRVVTTLLSVPEDEVRFEDGDFFAAASPKKRLSLREVAEHVASGAELPTGGEPHFEATALFDPENFTSPFGTHICLVEVDAETGEVEIQRYVAVDDCGRVINPTIVEGQIHGGIAQGVGQALLEGVAYSEEAQPLTTSLSDYLLPKCTDLPEIETILCETPSRANPLGARSVGEAGAIGAPPAVINAVLDALAPFGVDGIDTPATPERLWRALEGAKNRA